MAIQFQCVSCSRPIEVDDQWARRLVECPFCHDTITVPAMSTIQSGGMAAPISPYGPAASQYSDASYRPQSRNALAIWALVLAILAIVTVGATIIYAAVEISAKVDTDLPQAELEGVAQKLIEEAAERMEPWVVVTGLGMLAGGGLWLAGFICSIIAMTRRARRGLAIAAFVTCLVPAVIVFLV